MCSRNLNTTWVESYPNHFPMKLDENKTVMEVVGDLM